MAQQEFKATKKDLITPIWLIDNSGEYAKFWEISLKQTETLIRCGKVLCEDPLIEEPAKDTSQKVHNSVDEALKYVDKHVNTKLGRGYKFLDLDSENKKRGRSDSQNSDLSALDEDINMHTEKKVQINVISAPDSNGNNGNQQIQNQNLLGFNNNKKKSTYSETSKNATLSELTDISQQKSRSNSFNNGTAVDVSKLGNTSNGCFDVLLAKKWEKDINPTGWFMSEKMDGVRGLWTGSQLYSRNKNRFYAPDFWLKNFPKCQLDGELWTARDDFAKALSIVKKQKNKVDEDWKQIKYVVYDIPGLNKPFKQRVKAMQEILSQIDNPYIIIHPQVECNDMDHLEEELAEILGKDGEGVMIRDPNSKYEGCRSNTLLKVKVMHDEEATVIGYEDGSRSYAGLIGALKCRNALGIEFKVGQGLTDAERKKPPKVGTKITYKYQNKQPSGKPRFPVYVRPYAGM